jgi:hypothetical protein
VQKDNKQVAPKQSPWAICGSIVAGFDTVPSDVLDGLGIFALGFVADSKRGSCEAGLDQNLTHRTRIAACIRGDSNSWDFVKFSD